MHSLWALNILIRACVSIRTLSVDEHDMSPVDAKPMENKYNLISTTWFNEKTVIVFVNTNFDAHYDEYKIILDMCK